MNKNTLVMKEHGSWISKEMWKIKTRDVSYLFLTAKSTTLNISYLFSVRQLMSLRLSFVLQNITQTNFGTLHETGKVHESIQCSQRDFQIISLIPGMQERVFSWATPPSCQRRVGSGR